MNNLLRILVIEDNPGDAALLENMLNEAGVRFELKCVERLFSAIEQIKSVDFDVILLDLGLPDSYGLDTLIKLNEAEPVAPVIVLTGLADESIGTESVKAGAQDYLVKGQIDKNLLSRSISHAIERKRSTEALQVAASEWSASFDAMSDGVSIHNVDNTILNANRTLCELLGKTADEMIGKKCCQIFHGKENPIADCPVTKTINTKQKAYSEIFEPTLNKWLSVSVSPVFDSSGILIRNVHAVRDITEHKQAEEENAKLAAQLQQAQKMEAVGRLAGGVAHDFNNMLNVILGHAEIAMGRIDTADPLYASLEEIRKAGERSADLTRQLLAFARKQTIMPKVLDLNEAAGGMLNMLQRLIGEDIKLDWQPAAELWPVKVDPSQIDQLLANLCVNARDAIAGVGRITIETGNKTFDADYCAAYEGFVPGEYAQLSVSDDGCGMNKEMQSHLFEPFYTTKEVGKGTGLGLATVYGIVRQNNGFINVYSEPGHGTTFKIYLPRHLGKDELARAADVAGPALRGKETILLVEDEPAILNLTTQMLEMSGYSVLTAKSPGEAIRLAREHSGEIHLLITDVIMPEMNGRDLAKNLLSLFKDMKRLFMSGYTADVIAHHGVLDEGVHFLQKPFSLQSLTAKVREVLDSK